MGSPSSKAPRTASIGRGGVALVRVSQTLADHGAVEHAAFAIGIVTVILGQPLALGLVFELEPLEYCLEERFHPRQGGGGSLTGRFARTIGCPRLNESRSCSPPPPPPPRSTPRRCSPTPPGSSSARRGPSCATARSPRSPRR